MAPGKPWSDPTLLIPALTLLGAALSDASSRSGSLAQLTTSDGEPILVSQHQVFAIHPSTMRVRDRRCTTVHVLGRSEPLLVLEAPSVVASRLGGGMAVLHVPGSWLELGPAEVQVLVAACHVSLVEPSSFRIQSRRLTNVHLPQSVIMQVFEDIPTVARILGL